MSQRRSCRRSCELAGRPGKVLRAAISVALLSAVPGVARAENWTQWTSLQCYYEVKDPYGRPVPGVGVGLEFWGDTCPNTPWMSGSTGPDGKATLYRSAGAYDCYGNQVVINSFRCVVYENASLTSNMTATSYSATTLSLTTIVPPNPEHQHFTSGFVNDGGPCTESNGECASAELYLGADGVYDNVVVVPEPINPSYYRRSARQMWKEYNGDPNLLGGTGILQQLRAKGYDVWIVRTDTLQDVWEQAAQYAQAVQYAVSGNHGYGSPAGGTVTAFGFSMAGLIGRAALTRWDYDSWDPGGGGAAWRNGLGLQSTVPVRLMAMGDSPLRGGQANEDYMDVAWRETNASEFMAARLDMCSPRQMLQWSRDTTGFNRTGWDAFFENGGGFGYYGPDWTWHYCPGGPPILTQGRNGNGWPAGIRKIGWSQGKKGETQRCYGDATGKDLNGDNIDVCARTDVWTPTTGSQALWIEKKVDVFPDGLSRDWHIYYKRMAPNQFGDDLESGSKHDISEHPDVRGWKWGFSGTAEFHQYGPIGTYIPLRSALDRTCDPAVTSCPQVLDAEWTNSYNAAHRRLEKPQIDWLVAQLDASYACQSTGCSAVSCGWQTDNCGNSIWCGECQCQSTGCPGGSCGWQTDNCGSSLWCGECQCQSTGCPGGSCGWQTDNCGSSLWCGDCQCQSTGCPGGSCGWQTDNCGNGLWCGDCI